MYTKTKNVLFLVALMKEHGIRQVVLSPGARNIPFAHSVEEDPDFVCHSVVDERSAAYYAMGLAQRLGEPVAISCTSSVAASNYLPGITEAFHLHVPILVLTADRNPHYLGQMENQMIDQINMYGAVCKKSINLPVVKDKEDEWYCQRLVNEALLALNHHGCGPVQVNYPIFGGIGDFTEDPLPEVRPIRRFEYGRNQEGWQACKAKLKSAKRILVICGENAPDSNLDQLLTLFSEKYNCLISREHISNVRSRGADDLFLAAQVISLKDFDRLVPDIVITYGNNYVSRFKDLLRARAGKFEHWLISESGEICDTVKSLTTIFEATPVEFFESMTCACKDVTDNRYRSLWNSYKGGIPDTECEYSGLFAIKQLASELPGGSLVHTGILDATRILQHYPLKEGIKAYSNVGAYGIDGSMSTFMGQAAVTDNKCFLVIGDLSFFYDMNALQIQSIRNNVRVFLVNNSGAAEFHFFMGRDKIPSINKNIAAEHGTHAKGWVESRGMKYLAAKDKETFQIAMAEFLKDSDVPVVFEVFTDKEQDAKILKNYYAACAKEGSKALASIDASMPVVQKSTASGAKKKLSSLFGR